LTTLAPDAVALALFAGTVRHGGMGSDGDCAFTSATLTPSFYRSGQKRRGASRGQSPLPITSHLSPSPRLEAAAT